MAIYEWNGSTYELPDDVSPDRALQMIQEAEGVSAGSQGNVPQAGSQTYQYGPVPESISPEELVNNRDYLTAASYVYKMLEGQDYKGSKQDLVDWSKELMSQFNSNTVSMGWYTSRVNKAPLEQARAFLQLMEMYDAKEATWAGAGRYLKGLATDPFTWVGLSTLGVGTVARQGVQQGGKEAVKRTLLDRINKESMKRGAAIGAVEGSMFAGYDNRMRQSVRIAAEEQEGVDYGELAASGLIGAAAGGVLGAGIDVIGQGIRGAMRRGSSGESNETADAVIDEINAGQPSKERLAELESDPLVQQIRAEIQREEAQLADRVGDRVANYRPFDADEVDGPTANTRGNREAVDAANEARLVDLRDFDLKATRMAVPYERTTIEDMVARASNLANQIADLSPREAEDFIDELRTSKLTAAEYDKVKDGARIARVDMDNQLKEIERKLQHTSPNSKLFQHLLQERMALEPKREVVQKLDDTIGSYTGRSLGARAHIKSYDDVVETDIQPGDSDEVVAKKLERAIEAQGLRDRIAAYDRRIEEARKRGDVAEVVRLTTERGMMRDEWIDKAMQQNPGLTRKAVELAISNVFSATTIQINVVPSLLKTLYRPALDYIVSNPLSKANYKEMMGQYGAMKEVAGAAFEAAKSAFRYEQNLLNRRTNNLDLENINTTNNRFLESGLAMKGRAAGLIRIIPRVMAFTDEILSQAAYAGFIKGRAAGLATEEGIAKGLKGRELEDYIAEKTQDVIENSFVKADPANPEHLAPIVNKGVNMGLEGKKLVEFVVKEAKKSLPSMRLATDEEALQYTEDLLFKRALSGENGQLSALAKGYENLINKAPWLRLIGQLFFRTLVRIMEEGFRLTPGLNLATSVVHRGFINDLRGANGRAPQLRAQGEALLSIGIGLTVFSLYAEGKITGSGAYANWRQQQHRRDTDRPEPYTLYFDDGSTWNYQNFDPFATPVKIIVNALEGYENLQMRKMQGEDVFKTDEEKMMEGMMVGVSAISSAIKDAGLAEGIDQLSELAESAQDMGGDAFLRFVGDKLNMAVPNTLHKTANLIDPELKDPVSLMDQVETSIFRPVTFAQYEGDVANSYDVFGLPREYADKGKAWNIFSTATPEERQRGMTEDQLVAKRFIDDIQKQTSMQMMLNPKIRELGNMDLRRVKLPPGHKDRTLYDRYARYYREMLPWKAIADIARSSDPAMGTFYQRGATAEAVQDIIRKYQEAAFNKMLSEDGDLLERLINVKTMKAEARAGERDVPWLSTNE